MDRSNLVPNALALCRTAAQWIKTALGQRVGRDASIHQGVNPADPHCAVADAPKTRRLTGGWLPSREERQARKEAGPVLFLPQKAAQTRPPDSQRPIEILVGVDRDCRDPKAAIAIACSLLNKRSPSAIHMTVVQEEGRSLPAFGDEPQAPDVVVCPVSSRSELVRTMWREQRMSCPDLVVVAKPAENGWERLIGGTLIGAVLDHAHCPVLSMAA